MLVSLAIEVIESRFRVANLSLLYLLAVLAADQRHRAEEAHTLELVRAVRYLSRRPLHAARSG